MMQRLSVFTLYLLLSYMFTLQCNVSVYIFYFVSLRQFQPTDLRIISVKVTFLQSVSIRDIRKDTVRTLTFFPSQYWLNDDDVFMMTHWTAYKKPFVLVYIYRQFCYFLSRLNTIFPPELWSGSGSIKTYQKILQMSFHTNIRPG